MHNIKFRTSKI